MKHRTLPLLLLALCGFLPLVAAFAEAPPVQDECQCTGSGGAPVIGIASLTNETYAIAIREAGGIPVVLPNTDGSIETVGHYLQILDGLLMPGGADIPPSEWGEEVHPTTKLLEENRYLFEKNLITRWIRETKKPLLGICLGSQWVNVAHGGSLIQDIPSELNVNHRDVTHHVDLAPDSRLRAILGTDSLEVNSLHHQAVRDVGKGLRPVAKSPDGVIEAVEATDADRFLFGLQWHPEKLIGENPVHAKIFEAFVEASAATKAKSTNE